MNNIKAKIHKYLFLVLLKSLLEKIGKALITERNAEIKLLLFV